MVRNDHRIRRKTGSYIVLHTTHGWETPHNFFENRFRSRCKTFLPGCKNLSSLCNSLSLGYRQRITLSLFLSLSLKHTLVDFIVLYGPWESEIERAQCHQLYDSFTTVLLQAAHYYKRCISVLSEALYQTCCIKVPYRLEKVFPMCGSLGWYFSTNASLRDVSRPRKPTSRGTTITKY